MKLIVGLGNPGNKYHQTRHNLGFLVIDKLLIDLDLKLDKEKFNGHYTTYGTGKNKVIIAKPMTFMNNSGSFISMISAYFGIAPSDILVIMDDKDLPLGKFRLKENGSSGGHNGIQNIIDHLGTTSFNRLRCGIGYNSKHLIIDYVLQKWPQEQKLIIEKELPLFAKIAKDFPTHTIKELREKYTH